ncbi:hypothetical protein BaRGS_00036374 [Batillaria attramentaria]|uniref:Uncharacterized protein n=1 Tax=Batillaria attramentaria TaxID=370345 RepID=A0ABD0JC27_9CAEN
MLSAIYPDQLCENGPFLFKLPFKESPGATDKGSPKKYIHNYVQSLLGHGYKAGSFSHEPSQPSFCRKENDSQMTQTHRWAVSAIAGLYELFKGPRSRKASSSDSFSGL